MIASDRILFVGIGTSAVCYYRVLLPASMIGADYVGLYGDPPDAKYATGLVKGDSALPKFMDYDVVVLQQPRGPGWMKLIRALQAEGILVIFEVDDYLHGIRYQKDHDFKEAFDRRALAEYEAAMKLCDAVITTTESIATAYKNFNKKIYVCPNGVDVNRYNYRLPSREHTAIGWAGATGHRDAIVPWLQAVARVMAARPNVNFVSIGQPYGEGFREHFGDERSLSIPFAAIEQYPAAMTSIDIAIGPAAHTSFYRGKSDLRFLEAGALGIPIVAHPLVYESVKHGVTGMLAASPDEVYKHLLTLVDDRDLAGHIGANARRYVHAERSAEIAAARWSEVIEDALTTRRPSPG